MNGRVSVGGMKVDDGASYCATACWADVIDNEVQRHVSSLSLQANGGPSKGSAKDCDVARTHGRLAMAPQSNRYCNFAVRICRDPLGQISPVSTGASAESRGERGLGNCRRHHLKKRPQLGGQLRPPNRTPEGGGLFPFGCPLRLTVAQASPI